MRGSIKKDASGRWMFAVDLPTSAGRRRQVRRRGFDTKKAAEAALSDLLTDARRGSLVEANSETVGGYMVRWLDSLPAAGLRPSTVASYRQKNRLYIEPAVGDVGLQALAALELDTLYGAMEAKGLSLRTIRYTHSIVRKALQDAFRKGLVVKNVADQASPPRSQNTKPPEPDVWTPEELARFLTSIAGSVHHPLLRTAAMTGMRRSEVCGIAWSGVDLAAATMTVTRNLHVVGGEAEVGPVKTRRSRRTIDIDAETVAMLKAWRRHQVEQRLMMGEGWRDEFDLVFTQADGSPWRPDYISRHFRTLVLRAKVPVISLHGLRHSHASHLLAAGVNARVVSDRLGHSTVAFTLDTYAHVMPGQQAEAAAAVSSLVDGIS